MRFGGAVAAGGLMLLAASALHAQDASIPVLEAKQCSVWASYLSAEIPDEDTREALMFATNYFTGYYEGATGRAIGDQDDMEALMEVSLDLERFTEVCATHMVDFGTRMASWGDFLSALGEEAVEPSD